MTIKEFYEHIGGDYEMAKVTFRKEERMYQYLMKYAKDTSYDRLCEAEKNGDIKEAFEAVHALKGITGMFYFTPLYQAVVKLVEQLRPQNEPIDEELFQNLKKQQMIVLSELEKITVEE